MFGNDTAALHLGKYHSMLVADTMSSAKRLYSPQIQSRFVPTAGHGLKSKEMKPYVIGICGGPSSGKSTVANMLKRKIPHAVILNLINFYHPVRGNLRRRSRADSFQQDKKVLDESQMKNELIKVYRDNDFDTPEAIDWELLNRAVEKLRAG